MYQFIAFSSQLCEAHNIIILFLPIWIFFKDFIYLFMRNTHTHRGRDTGGGRGRLHAPGARCGIRSQDSRITPGPKAGATPLSHPGIPGKCFFTLHTKLRPCNFHLFYDLPSVVIFTFKRINECEVRTQHLSLSVSD